MPQGQLAPRGMLCLFIVMILYNFAKPRDHMLLIVIS
nr:MAG TPA: hypothetical protein [Caudoviricetes sp.]